MFKLTLRFFLVIWIGFLTQESTAQSFREHFASLKKLKIDSGVTLTFDEPVIHSQKPTHIILYTLPNGNTTAQTFGKVTGNEDDWHYNIQHIGAQTAFIRQADPATNYVVVYLENDLKSWPAWRKKHEGSDARIARMVGFIYQVYRKYNPKITLSGHSGGGSFIFGYINSQTQIPACIERIGFLDATYGYETELHQRKLETWLKNKGKSLQVVAYNDSVVVYNGKPLVSPTGGTWYRSKLMAGDLQQTLHLKFRDLSDRLSWRNKGQNIDFTLIKNPEGRIFHTVLVEKNGFIHMVLNGTQFQNKNYDFWQDRQYQKYVLE